MGTLLFDVHANIVHELLRTNKKFGLFVLNKLILKKRMHFSDNFLNIRNLQLTTHEL